MTVYYPKFDSYNFEKRGEISTFLTSEQRTNLTDISIRVSSQLDWIAQMLGWSGRDYWDGLASTIDQKRQLIGGTFGVYNSFVFPKVIEVRSWKNSILIENEFPIEENQVFYVGDYSYTPDKITSENNQIILEFEQLSSQLVKDLGNNQQLRTTCSSLIPEPFVRPQVGVSGDYSFHCKTQGGVITLFPDFDVKGTQPYTQNVLFAGSRYFFDSPVSLATEEYPEISPTYDFERGLWYLDVPKDPGYTGSISNEDGSLPISFKVWEDPTDWLDHGKLESFYGTWGNKGGVLPLHFCFDALSLHGYMETSVSLEEISREISFDTLLNFVYQQSTQVDTLPIPSTQDNQLWWDSSSKKLLIHPDKTTDCGPWLECEYPEGLPSNQSVDFTFANASEFLLEEGNLSEGSIVEITNCNGIDPESKVLGITGVLTNNLRILAYKSSLRRGWVAIEVYCPNVVSFEANCVLLPFQTYTLIENAEGLSSSGLNYDISNLKITVNGEYKVRLCKSEGYGTWVLKPPSHLKYISDTRLFSSSQDYENPTEGEMHWDYENPDVENREGFIFQYDRWEFNPSSMEWELKGNWFNLNTGLIGPEPAENVNYLSLKVHCDSNLLQEGEDFLSENFVFSYEIGDGSLIFKYTPKNFVGMYEFPEVYVTDSVTSAFRFSITDLIFSGLIYKASPSVLNAEKLLRIWKTESLFCIESPNKINTLSCPNALIADSNSGPGDPNWEKFFIRLPTEYERNGVEWQKVSKICQGFSYWGSPQSEESMKCPPQEESVILYEELAEAKSSERPYMYVYEEPYLNSYSVISYGDDNGFDNSLSLPSTSTNTDEFESSYREKYNPLHNRRAIVNRPVGKGYGDWEGSYYRYNPCSEVTGHLSNEISSNSMEKMDPPMWDSSMYKVPKTCLLDTKSSEVDSNHYVMGYAFFCADISAANEPMFDVG